MKSPISLLYLAFPTVPPDTEYETCSRILRLSLSLVPVPLWMTEWPGKQSKQVIVSLELYFTFNYLLQE